MQVQIIYSDGKLILPDNIELKGNPLKLHIELPSEIIRRVSMKAESPLKELAEKYPDDVWLRKLLALDQKNRAVAEKDLPVLTERQLDNIEAFAAYKDC